MVRNQEGNKDLAGEGIMLERIRTFFGKVRGQHAHKKTIVEEGTLYRCTKCHLIFTTKSAGEQHDCRERL